jgi:hypothetical protein
MQVEAMKKLRTLATWIIATGLASGGAHGQTGNSEGTAETCHKLAVKSAVDKRCAVHFAKQALIAQHIDPSIYKRFEARFLPDRSVWVVTARFEPPTPDGDKDVVVALDGSLQLAQ